MSEDEGEYFPKDEEDNFPKEEMLNLPKDENKNLPREENLSKEENKNLTNRIGTCFASDEKKSIYYKQRWKKTKLGKGYA